MLQFHWYGFLIGLGLVAGLYWVEYLLKRKSVPKDFFWQLVSYVLVGGLIGSRLWHVATDYELYANNLLGIFEIWNGGLSIIGTICGALLAFIVFFKIHPQWKEFQLITLDLSVFGVALGQIIGRFGNYLNQELYGLPSNLFISIFIDVKNRLPGFEHISYYHPLFAYEAILMGIFLILAWKLQHTFLKVGTGKLFVFYVAYYSWIRFALDFLRIDKAASPIFGLGINQLFLLCVAVGTTALLLNKRKGAIFSFLIFSMMLVSGCSSAQNLTHQKLVSVPDHSFQTLRVGDRTVKVEVVNTPASVTQGLSDREEIGSDGLLFIFPQKEYQRFWMKDMKMDLDLIWLSDMKVVDVSENVPKPAVGQALNQLPIYAPKVPVNAVLEVPAGTAKNWNLKIGDSFF